MTPEDIAAWVERFQVILAALPVLIGMALKAWHDIKQARAWWASEDDRKFKEAAEFLWAKGQQLKPVLKAANQGGDFGAVLRSLAPSALHAYGKSHGLTDADIQKVLDLARALHKRKKAERLPSAASVLEVELPADPLDGAGSTTPAPSSTDSRSGA